MARKRMVSPAFFKHADLFDAEKATGLPLRLAYEALWCQSDRRGYFAWKPRELKTDCLPYDDCDFSDVLEALVKYGFVVPYVVNGKRYARIPTFLDHQSFHVAEKPDRTLPEPPPEGSEDAQAPDKHRAEVVQAPDKHRASTPVAVTVAVTDTVTVTAGTKRPAAVADVPAVAPRAARPPRAAPAFAGFSKPLCDAVYATWLERAGAVAYPRLRRAFGPILAQPEAERPPGLPRDDEVVPAVAQYLACALGTSEARFRTPERCAERLGTIVREMRLHPDDAEARLRGCLWSLGITEMRG